MKITIQDKTVNLLFGYTAFKTFMTGLFRFPDKYQVEDAAGKLQFTSYGLAKIIHAAHECYCLEKDKELVVGYSEVAEWLDTSFETEKELIGEILESWAKSQHVEKMVKEFEKKSQPVNQVSQSELTSTPLSPSVSEPLE